MGILQVIGNACLAVAKAFGWADGRSALKNKEDVRQAATAKQAEGRKADIEEAVANEDVEAVRRNIS